MNDTAKRKAEYGYIGSAKRCGNCKNFKTPAHCLKGAFPVNAAAICNFHIRSEYRGKHE